MVRPHDELDLTGWCLSCLILPAQRVGVVDGFVGAFSTAKVKGEGDVAGGGEDAGAATVVFEGWLRMP